MIEIESALLLVELVLLIFTVILLLFHLKQDKVHKNLIREMNNTTRVLTRQEYFSEVIHAFQETEKSIFGCITGNKPLNDDDKNIDIIVKNIRDLTKKGVKISFLIPKFPNRLYIGYRYSTVGADIRYNNCAISSDIRYMIIDEKFVIVGIPEIIGANEPTKKGYRIPSMGISSILHDHLNQCWGSDISLKYEKYVKEIIDEIKSKDEHYSLEPLARELGIPKDELKRIQSQK